MEETLAVTLPSILTTRLRNLAQAAAVPVDRFVAQTLEATLETIPPSAAPQTTHSPAPHQEAVVIVLHRMAEDAQARMTHLMTHNTEGDLTAAEESELALLVAEYEQIMLANSEQLLAIQLFHNPTSTQQ
ncbi:MAG: hypothetical protein KDE53_32140 [Caldilineaceae bacterium]|nr:hypothetical protein [Caldilineaceae bacterium]MCB0123643.1 hypothetical protein [Caldilineaceae bacterium]